MQNSEDYQNLWWKQVKKIGSQDQSVLVDVILQNDIPVSSKIEILAEAYHNRINQNQYPPSQSSSSENSGFNSWAHNHRSNRAFERIEKTALLAHLPHRGGLDNVVKINEELRYKLLDREYGLIRSGAGGSSEFNAPEPDEDSPEKPSRAELNTLETVKRAVDDAGDEMQEYVGYMKYNESLPPIDTTPDFGLEVLMYGRLAIFLENIVEPEVSYSKLEIDADQVLIEGALEATSLDFRSPDDITTITEEGEEVMAPEMPVSERIRQAGRETLAVFLADSFYRPQETTELTDIVRHFDPQFVEQFDDEDISPDSLEKLADDSEPEDIDYDGFEGVSRWKALLASDISVEPDEEANRVDFSLEADLPRSLQKSSRPLFRQEASE